MTAPQQADFVFVPLLDAQFALGQVERVGDDWADVLFTVRVLPTAGNAQMIWSSDILARLRVPLAPLVNGDWSLGGYNTLPNASRLDDDKDIQDQAIVEAFLSAVHGLLPWAAFGDPAIFDALLLDPADTRVKRAS